MADIRLARQARDIRQWAVRLVCALALLFAGFAHQVPVIEKGGVKIDVAQYVLPDGTLPIFCITDNSDTGQKPKMRMVGCQACHINASILVPRPTDVDGSAVHFIAIAAGPIRTANFIRPLFPPDSRPRAPPSSPQTA